MSRKVSVPDRLVALAKINRARGKVYGKDYKYVGKSLLAMFPNGLTLESAEEFNRFALFVMLHCKLVRYAQNIKKGGHADSLNDLAVYAQMMREVDDEGVGS